MKYLLLLSWWEDCTLWCLRAEPTSHWYLRSKPTICGCRLPYWSKLMARRCTTTVYGSGCYRETATCRTLRLPSLQCLVPQAHLNPWTQHGPIHFLACMRQISVISMILFIFSLAFRPSIFPVMVKSVGETSLNLIWSRLSTDNWGSDQLFTFKATMIDGHYPDFLISESLGVQLPLMCPGWKRCVHCRTFAAGNTWIKSEQQQSYWELSYPGLWGQEMEGIQLLYCNISWPWPLVLYPCNPRGTEL